MQIQNDLFDAGADLSTPVVENPEYPPLRITQPYIDRLEAWCDDFNEAAAGAELVHPARRHRRCRRCCTSHGPWHGAPSGRRGSAVKAYPDTVSPLPAKYLNRLSDLLFILSRVANPDGDVLWQPGGANAEGPREEVAQAVRRRARGDGLDSTQDRNAVSAPRSSAISYPRQRSTVVSCSSSTTISSVMMSNSSPRGARREMTSSPRRLSRRSGHHRRLDSR